MTVGGGITNEEEIQKLLSAGADKITLNSSAYSNPELIENSAKKYGSQCVVISIDAKLVDGQYKCLSHSGTQFQDVDIVEWAQEVASRGAGEILITSIDNDGTMNGYDFSLIDKVVKAVDVPVIASGGAGSYEDMRVAIILWQYLKQGQDRKTPKK